MAPVLESGEMVRVRDEVNPSRSPSVNDLQPSACKRRIHDRYSTRAVMDYKTTWSCASKGRRTAAFIVQLRGSLIAAPGYRLAAAGPPGSAPRAPAAWAISTIPSLLGEVGRLTMLKHSRVRPYSPQQTQHGSRYRLRGEEHGEASLSVGSPHCSWRYAGSTISNPLFLLA